VLRKYLSKAKRRSTLTATGTDAAGSAALGGSPNDSHWQKLVAACHILDLPIGFRSPEGMHHVCIVMRDIHFFGCAFMLHHQRFVADTLVDTLYLLPETLRN
jgi:hypothetical protein